MCVVYTHCEEDYHTLLKAGMSPKQKPSMTVFDEELVMNGEVVGYIDVVMQWEVEDAIAEKFREILI